MENKKEDGKKPFRCENHVVLAGRLAKDPIISGDEVKRAFFTLAVERRFNKGGNKGKETSYIPVVAWRSLAEKVAKVGKGSGVRVEGTLRQSMIPQKGTKEQREVWEVSAYKATVEDTWLNGKRQEEAATAK